MSRLFSFLRCNEGVAYLEFAICLPFLMMMLLGGIEVTRYIVIVQKTEKTAMTLSDIISQGKTISTSDINNFIYAASQVMLPYTMGANGYVIVSSVKQTGTWTPSNPPLVDWQYTSSGANGSWTQPTQVGHVGYAATIPTGIILNDKDNVIVTEFFYNYQPLIATNGVISNKTIYKTAVFKPRLGDLSILSSSRLWWLTQGALL